MTVYPTAIGVPVSVPITSPEITSSTSPILLISAGPGVHLNGWLHDFVPTLGLSWGR
jgi:hypothetical protein